MAKFRVIEEVIGRYEYQAPIDENTVGDFNKYMESAEGYEPLSVVDVIDLLNDDTDNPRYNDTYTKTYAWDNDRTYTCYLSSEVYDWFSDLAWDYPVGDIEVYDTLDVNRDII